MRGLAQGTVFKNIFYNSAIPSLRSYQYDPELPATGSTGMFSSVIRADTSSKFGFVKHCIYHTVTNIKSTEEKCFAYIMLLMLILRWTIYKGFLRFSESTPLHPFFSFELTCFDKYSLCLVMSPKPQNEWKILLWFSSENCIWHCSPQLWPQLSPTHLDLLLWSP